MTSVEDWTVPVLEALRGAADPVRAAGMAAYMRHQFVFLGVPTPARRALVRAVTATLPPPDPSLLSAVVRSLWAETEREAQYAASDLLRRHLRHGPPWFLGVLEELVVTKSWWDTVDELAHHVGSLVRTHPDLVADMEAWVLHANVWKARVAILHQLGWKQACDEDRLFRFCLARADDREFFLRKAIGWALRDHSSVAPDAVAAFVAGNAERLSPLSRREALKAVERRRRRAARPAQPEA